jgi:D-cysteine desulfhydrase
MKFTYPKFLPLANLPTPIERLERLSNAWDGPDIYVKRDDLTGCAVSGNKIRKLAFSVAEAMDQGADTLITCGGIQSNHARATALVAARIGMACRLILWGEPPKSYQGNLLLDRLVGADIQFIPFDSFSDIESILADTAQQLRQSGKRPYIIPEGASNEIGYFGYIQAAEEIQHQLKEMRLKMDYIITAVGSGGTLGGLVLGQVFFGLNAEPIGINVNHTASYFQDRISGVIDRMIEKCGWKLKLPSSSIRLIDGYVGKGYAVSRPEELSLIAEVARLEGLILDPVYTGKAMFGLRDQIRKRRFTKGQKILFLHTGGIFGVFSKNREFEESLSLE